MPDVRHELLTTLKEKLVPLNVLDEFKSAGVFVNWWQQIRYDLKTIISTGWHHTLIPDDYLIAEYFQAEADAIEAVEATISEKQSELAEAVEAGQEVAEHEPEEEETVSAKTIKDAIKVLIQDIRGSGNASDKADLKRYKAADKAIRDLEKAIQSAKAEEKRLRAELEHKLMLKRLGGDGFTAESRALIDQVDRQLAELDLGVKADPSSQELRRASKKKIKALNKDKATLEARITATDALLEAIGGPLTDDEARTLILRKLYDIVHAELDRYLNTEKRALVAGVEKLWDKYAVSSQQMERDREGTLNQLNTFLQGLGYFGPKEAAR